MKKRILITAGPTREPIDAVRFISNRSSGTLGLALASAGLEAGHDVTLILGPVAFEPPAKATSVRVETTQQMQEEVMRAFPEHDLLIMAAAVADYRPRSVTEGKLERADSLVLELEKTQDIVAAAAAGKRQWQAVVGFSLEAESDVARAQSKLQRKGLDLMVFNPLRTMNSGHIEAVLLYPSGREEHLPELSKAIFARHLMERCLQLLPLR